MAAGTNETNDMAKHVIFTKLTGSDLLKNPLLNKDTAFSEQERQELRLDGLLPYHIEDIEDQVKRCYVAYSRKNDPLEKHIYLRALQDRNITLFYKLVIEHLNEMMPIIYTPIVGEACQLFSRIYRQPRGLFISYSQKDRILDILANFPSDDIKVIVVTDGERILGLGDQGAGGMGIPIGKLSLYTACGGINPENTLPILLDIGTNNEELRNDPAYIGWRHERITGDDYYEFIDAFVSAVKTKFPNVLLQFEDFSQAHASPLLKQYRDKLCTFNDDIQGTAAVTVSALIAAIKSAGTKLQDQRIAVFGSGSAGCGISEQLVSAMMRLGLSEKEARSRFYLLGRRGLLHDGMSATDAQKNLLQPKEKVMAWISQGPSQGASEQPDYISLMDVVKNAKPTILLGVSGSPNQFTQEIVEQMMTSCDCPIIFPMSNPTSRSEAKPEDLLRWSHGRALIATGSPFADVELDGKTYRIAQSNNCYIFPGLGLGVLASGATRVSDNMFMAASLALSELAPALHQKGGALLPALSDIRNVSKKIAFAVGKQAQDESLAQKISEQELQQRIEQTMWTPSYGKIQLVQPPGGVA